MLGLGVTPEEILLQAVGSADDPSSAGRQMPCHWGSRRLNVVTQSSPTGSQCLPAVGCAEAARYISRRDLPGCSAQGDEVTYVSLGEGATSEGEFWESLNTACTLALPVLFVVADNGYAISVPSADQSPAPISDLVAGFRGLAVHRVDGCDYFGVRRQAAEIVAHVRAG
jgi:2-oxoisovalerate dehydrogenase E1 component